MGGSSEVEVLETAQDVLASFVMPESSLAVCLVSGGMDSCVTAAIANEENDALAFLHVSYGQRTEARERQAFEELAHYYRVAKRLDVSIEHLKLVGGSSLTDEDSPVSEAKLLWDSRGECYGPGSRHDYESCRLEQARPFSCR